MVAFSGEVTLEDHPGEKPYTEATMNLDEQGSYITTDKKFRRAFHSSQYNILVLPTNIRPVSTSPCSTPCMWTKS